VKNGIVCLECGERFPHDPKKYPSLIQIPHPYYTPEEMKERIAARPKGHQFLGEKIVFKFLCNVMNPPDVRLAIDYWGYCLVGDNRFQKDLMDVGPPDSGKSLHLNITKAYLGPKYMAHKSLKELTQNRFAKADLYGKLANTCSDISSSKLIDIEAFKLIASGDDISAEKKNRDPFTFVPFTKLMFSANTPPLPNEELDDAYYKRWILLVFGMKKKDFLDKSKDVVINRDMLKEIQQGQNAPRDAEKLRKLLEIKQRQKEEQAMHIEDTQRLVTEIEMLKVVLYLSFASSHLVQRGLQIVIISMEGSSRCSFTTNDS
jgi:phage/plasmid-associated DNA primase